MDKDRGERRGLDGGSEVLDFLFIQRRIAPSPRISGEELDGLAASCLGPFDDPRESSSNGNMETKSHLTPLKKDYLKVTIRYVINCSLSIRM